MTSIHELARNGTLTKAQVRQAKKSVNELDANGVPPLALAARMGHLDTVRLLLREGANPNLKDRNGATALNVAARYASKDRAAIIRALLKWDAAVDAPDPNMSNNTPLMAVVVQNPDLDSISELLKKGASLSVKNDFGKTAENLAKNDWVVAALQRKPDKNVFSKVVEKITNFALRTLVLLNTPLMSGVRFLTRMYNYTPRVRSRPEQPLPPAPEATREAPEETPKEEPVETPERKQEREIENQLKEISDKIKESNLSKFTGMDDRFLDTLAEKTIALRKDISTDLGQPRNLPDMINLALYKPVLYCDDSGSMEGEGYEYQRNMVKRICRVTTKLVPDDLGVDLHFINHRQGFADLREDEINEQLKTIKPDGGTTIGTNLERKILDPLVYKPLESGGLKRPLLISIITDGEPTGESADKLKTVILDCKERLDKHDCPAYAVVFQISQVGDSDAADEFLRELKDDDELKGTLMVTTDRLDKVFEAQKENEKGLEVWLLKTLVEPIYRWGPDFVKKQRSERRKNG
ncbi:hypothetical protein C7999DRAFT_13811 [Corynascus novoguineensis]|uniref:Ankyrin repeat protein n=1 Tax=Corynascus novoguineensis TaxID=1126955 RepID=A0AAN7CW13_9PEZI|nr:hypothetical protein C7999DRAFT_13811 [Corynascus novoguineensis]